MFKAIVIDKNESQNITSSLTELEISQLPENDVLLDVEYTTLNYKDCLAICNKSPIAKKYPMIPGIDLAGTVIKSKSSKFIEGDKVFLNGWGHGEKYWGGMTKKACIESKYLLKVPKNLNTFDVMSIGTAGYTAMLAIAEIEKKK